MALDKGKFKPPPPMKTPIEIRNANKFCEFHGEVGHTTDECMHLKRQIEEMLKAGKQAGKLVTFNQRNLKQRQIENTGKAAKKEEETSERKTVAIMMEWDRGQCYLKDDMGGHFVPLVRCSGASSYKSYMNITSIDSAQRSAMRWIRSNITELVGSFIMNASGFRDRISSNKKWQKRMRKDASSQSQGICYVAPKMPFGLKNARATYQRLVDKAF
ncbi:hypothetical protein Tco_0327221 [Tanacetum coccineum]